MLVAHGHQRAHKTYSDEQYINLEFSFSSMMHGVRGESSDPKTEFRV